MDRRIRQMSVNMQSAASRKIENRKRMPKIVVAASDDGTLPAFGHDEGQ